MKKTFRHIIAYLLTVIFAMIILSPLAPLAMWSPSVASKITGECSGDCDICGCSLERRSTRTCCCWQKKFRLQEEEKENSQNVPPCCISKKSAAKKIQKKMFSFKSNCPCERGKIHAIFGSAKCPLITCLIVEIEPVYTESRMTSRPLLRMKERPGEPPDPPPKLTIYSWHTPLQTGCNKTLTCCCVRRVSCVISRILTWPLFV